MEGMAGQKRSFSAFEASDWPPYPADTVSTVGVDMKSSFPYAQRENTNFDNAYNIPFSSIDSSFILPVDFTVLDFQSAALPIDPLPAYDYPTMAFQPDLNNHMSSPSHFLPDSRLSGYELPNLRGDGQPRATTEPSHSPTMMQSLQPYPRKRRSITSMDVPSAHGRSDGSEYFTDSPYDFQGVMTPTTTQSYEVVERPPPEIDHNTSGMLTDQNDFMGLEINPSFQPPQFESRATEVYSRSPPGIQLDEIDSTSGMSAFSFHGVNWDQPEPWVPISTHPSPGLNLAQSWDTSYGMLQMDNLYPPQQMVSTPSRTYSSPKQPSIAGEGLSNREASYDSTNQPRVASREPFDSPSSNDPPNKVKRRPAGKRVGPVPQEKRSGIKKTRQARACWCCKMRKVTCNADKEHDCPECTRFWHNKMTGQFVNKRICYRTTLEDLQPIFIPDFMVEHFKGSQVKTFADDIVAKNGWMSGSRTEISLILGFGPPLIVKGVEEFRPNGVVNIFPWRRDNQNVVDTIQTLPLGIPQESLEPEGDALCDLEKHLDRIIDDKDDLMDFADRVLRSNEHSRSGRTFKVVLKWYQNWKDAEEPMQPLAESLLRNAIKVMMIIEIFGRRLIIEQIPEQFEKFFNEAPYTSRNYRKQKQSPRLINLQVKAALCVLQQKLLSKVLQGFGRELTQSEGWPTCFAVTIILAFFLEQMQEKSIRFYQKSKACGPLDRKSVKHSGSPNDIREYNNTAQLQIFDVIHMLLRCKSEKQTLSDKKSSKKISLMGSKLRKAMGDLKEDFTKETPEEAYQTQQHLQVGGEDAGRLVSALLELVQ